MLNALRPRQVESSAYVIQPICSFALLSHSAIRCCVRKDATAGAVQVPPAVNQHGKCVRPTVLMLVAHEMRIGCAKLPKLGAKYGDASTSETALMPPMLSRRPGTRSYWLKQDLASSVRCGTRSRPEILQRFGSAGSGSNRWCGEEN